MILVIIYSNYSDALCFFFYVSWDLGQKKKTNVPLIKLLKHHFSESDVSSTMKTHHCRIILEYTLYVVDCVPLPARVFSLLVLWPRGLDSKQEVGLRQALHSLCLLNLLQNRSNNIVQVAELLLRGLDGYGHF